MGDYGRNLLGLARFSPLLIALRSISLPRETVTARVCFGRVTGSGRGLLYPLSYRGPA